MSSFVTIGAKTWQRQLGRVVTARPPSHSLRSKAHCPLFYIPNLSTQPGTMVSARAATARLEKTFSRFQGFAVRADLRGSDNRRDRLSLSSLLEM